MKTNDGKKYNRKSTRLKGYDYTQSGFYFIIICTGINIKCSVISRMESWF
jgi:hypothetical protein